MSKRTWQGGRTFWEWFLGRPPAVAPRPDPPPGWHYDPVTGVSTHEPRSGTGTVTVVHRGGNAAGDPYRGAGWYDPEPRGE